METQVRTRSTQARREAAFKEMVEAEILGKLQRFEEGLQNGRAAVAELQAITSSDSSNQQAKMDLAMGFYRLGDVQVGAGRLGEGLENHESALELRKEQAALRGPSDLQANRMYVVSLNRVARLLLERRDRAHKAAEYLELSIALSQKLLAQIPSDIYVRAGLARAYRERADTAARAHQQGDRLRFLQQSVDLWHDIQRRDPLEVNMAKEAREAEGELSRISSMHNDG